MANWSSALEFGFQPVVGYSYRGCAVAVRVGVTIMIRFSVRVKITGRVDGHRVTELGCLAVVTC